VFADAGNDCLGCFRRLDCFPPISAWRAVVSIYPSQCISGGSPRISRTCVPLLGNVYEPERLRHTNAEWDRRFANAVSPEVFVRDWEFAIFGATVMHVLDHDAVHHLAGTMRHGPPCR
jgi:hypothetical protein